MDSEVTKRSFGSPARKKAKIKNASGRTSMAVFIGNIQTLISSIRSEFADR